MSPYQGSGAGQAVEDAYVLGSILANPLTTLENVSSALKVYEEIRLPHANEVQRRSDMAGSLYRFEDKRFSALFDSTGANGSNAVDPGKIWDIGHTAADIWKWAWVTDARDEERWATQLLKERLASDH